MGAKFWTCLKLLTSPSIMPTGHLLLVLVNFIQPSTHSHTLVPCDRPQEHKEHERDKNLGTKKGRSVGSISNWFSLVFFPLFFFHYDSFFYRFVIWCDNAYLCNQALIDETTKKRERERERRSEREEAKVDVEETGDKGKSDRKIAREREREGGK